MGSTPTRLDSLRRSLRAARRQHSEQPGLAAFSDRFSQEPALARATQVAAYLAFDGEVDVSAMIAAVLQAGSNCYVPVLGDDRSLIFRRYAKGQTLVANRYGIREPGPEADTIRPENLDLVLTPLVGFDAQGTRLGMGGGYYDRTFAFTLTGESVTPLLLGIAWDCQRVEQLTRQSWDVPLDAVLTESGLQIFNPTKFDDCKERWQSNTG